MTLISFTVYATVQGFILSADIEIFDQLSTCLDEFQRQQLL